LITLGLIIDEYHLEKKVIEFLNYMQKKVKINLYVEERQFVDFSKIDFEEDLFFVKAKGDLVINLVKLIEHETSIPIINSSKSIWLCYNRFLNSTLLRKVGVNVPEFSLNPIGDSPPFKDYIIKNIKDQKNYAFNPIIIQNEPGISISDERAITEAIGGSYQYNFLYYQNFIKSKWEYKVYCIGNELFYFKQLPVLINPNKMESRRKIKAIKELKNFSQIAIEALGLKIASLDFLKSEEGEYYLTDINSSPNFEYIKNGAKIVGDYLIKVAKS
jgi:glutathione synthase/RimK-type ligase-like ATP-grasp enzyme